MAVDLSDYIGTLKRQVIPPGSTLFSNVTNSQWLAYLQDAFWMARFDGFMAGYTETDGEITPIDGGSDLDLKYVALIALYASVNVLSTQILNTKTQFRAKAGPVEFEQQNSATMLAEMLKQLRQTKDRALTELDTDMTATVILDAYSTRLYSGISYWGAPELTG